MQDTPRLTAGFREQPEMWPTAEAPATMLMPMARAK